MNIYVANLSSATTDADLSKLFSSYGKVTSANVIMDKYTGSSRGFAFVEMESDQDGQEAIKQLNNSQVDGKAISVSVARPREDRGSKPPYSGGRKKW
jgi:RNA recognition motif-containing protein